VALRLCGLVVCSRMYVAVCYTCGHEWPCVAVCDCVVCLCVIVCFRVLCVSVCVYLYVNAGLWLWEV